MRALMVVLAVLLSGCMGPNETPNQDDAWTAFDSVGGFAGLGQRLVIEGDDAVWLSFDPRGAGGITTDESLADWHDRIVAWMQPAWGTIDHAHVTQARMLTLDDAAELRTELDAWAAEAGTGESDHTSNCADCFTHGFHHADPRHSSTAYGVSEEFDAPWGAWTDRMNAVQGRVIGDGAPLAAPQ